MTPGAKRIGAPPLMHEGRCRHLPAVTKLSDLKIWHHLGIGQKHLIERGMAVHLLQRHRFDARLMHVDDEIGQALVLWHVHVGAG